MGTFIIKKEECRRCGICVQVCPMNIIERKNESSYPEPSRDWENLCINCGHCVAACPYSAVFPENMPPENCPPVKNEWILDPEQTEHFLRSRRSIRVYKDTPVNKETINKLIKIAGYAPSGHNSQPVKWLVIHKKEDVQKITGHVIDWIKFMLKEHPDIAVPLHFDRVIKKLRERKRCCVQKCTPYYYHPW